MNSAQNNLWWAQWWVHNLYVLPTHRTSERQEIMPYPLSYLSIDTHIHILIYTHIWIDLQWWLMGHSARWYGASTWPKMTKTTIVMLHHSQPCLIWGCTEPIMFGHFFHFHREIFDRFSRSRCMEHKQGICRNMVLQTTYWHYNDLN